MSEEKEVTASDQKDINAFSKLNAAFHELEEELKVQKDELVNLQDAQNEVLMAMDDESVKMSIGEVFIDQTQDDAMEMLNAQVEEAEADVASREQKIVDIKSEMAILKARLTLKFGKSINLEDEPA